MGRAGRKPAAVSRLPRTRQGRYTTPLPRR